jgi:hypothetical protein
VAGGGNAITSAGPSGVVGGDPMPANRAGAALDGAALGVVFASLVLLVLWLVSLSYA